MSGPIRPPLRVRDSDSSPNVIPVNTIVVTDGDLVDDGGATVTIDTSGSGTEPATPADAIQFNSDPAGTFTASSDLTYTDTPHAGTDTLISANGAKLGLLFVGQNGEGTGNAQIETTEDGGFLYLTPRTTGQVFIQNDNAAGTLTDMDSKLSLIHGSTAGNESVLYLRNLLATNYAQFVKDDDDLTIKVIDTAAANASIHLISDGTGVVNIKNDESDSDSELVVFADGTGTPTVKLENGSMAVQIICEANKKFTIEGGAGGETFVFDASSATGGIQFPDGTELKSAEGTAILATGVTDGYVLTADGANAAAWEAAGGGGNVFNAEIPGDDSVNDRFIISQTPPWGSADKSTTVNLSIMSKPMCFPFIAPATGDITEIGIRLTTAASGNLYVAIYDSGSEGLADSLVCYATIAIDGSTGNLYQTSITGADPAVTRGTQYWYSFSESESSAAYAAAALVVNTPGVGLGTNISQDACAFWNDAATAYAVPPASFTNSYSYGGIQRPLCSLKIA